MPYMSPIRPMIGLAAAPTINVAVATHETAAMLVSKASARTGSSGIEIVCISAITATANASEPATELVPWARVRLGGVDGRDRRHHGP